MLQFALMTNFLLVTAWAKFEMFKNAQNSIILPFKNFLFAHQQKIGHQCKRAHKPQDNSFAFSHNNTLLTIIVSTMIYYRSPM